MEFDPFRHVLGTLNLAPAGEDRFLGVSHAMPHGRVFGGQVVAQSLIAAGRTVDPDRRPHSLHGYFMRAGLIDEPITFEVERMRDGGSFSTRRVHAVQFDEPIFSMQASFQLNQPGLEYAIPAPDLPGPLSVPDSFDQAIESKHPASDLWRETAAFELHHLTGSPFLTRAADTEAEQAVWVKARSTIPAEDATMQAAALSYVSDLLIIEPLLRRHSLTLATPGLRLASIDHAIWFHRPFDISHYLLFVTKVRSTSGGRGLSMGTVFNHDGVMVASITQEAMLRTGARGTWADSGTTAGAAAASDAAQSS